MHVWCNFQQSQAAFFPDSFGTLAFLYNAIHSETAVISGKMSHWYMHVQLLSQVTPARQRLLHTYPFPCSLRLLDAGSLAQRRAHKAKGVWVYIYYRKEYATHNL